MADFAREPGLFGAPDGLSSDLHTAAELEAAWEAMRGRIRELEREVQIAERDVSYWQREAEQARADFADACSRAAIASEVGHGK